MRVRAVCDDVLDVDADARVRVWYYHGPVLGGTTQRLDQEGRLTVLRLSRMRPATTLVLHNPEEWTHHVFVQDDGAMPFRQLVSVGLMAAYLHGSETIALSIHRSERKFPAVENSVEEIIEEVGLGYRAFEAARTSLGGPQHEMSELLIVSSDESAVAQVEAAIRSGWPMK
jgi:hypothetical protein